MTLFENRIFAGVIKLRKSHMRLEWAPSVITGVTQKGRFGGTHTHKEESHVKAETQTGVILYKPRMPKTASNHQRQEEKHEKNFSQSLLREHAIANTLILSF